MTLILFKFIIYPSCERDLNNERGDEIKNI